MEAGRTEVMAGWREEPALESLEVPNTPETNGQKLTERVDEVLA